MAKLLVAAQDLAPGVVKGDIVEIYPDSYEWGGKEGLPKFIRVTILNRTKEQILGHLESIVRAFNYSLDASNASGVRATISVDANLSGNFARALAQDVKDFILTGGEKSLSVAEHDQTANSLTVDIALADDEFRAAALMAFRDDINDKFKAVIGYRRYFFAPASVDTVVSTGGAMSVTAAQAALNIVDRFS